MERVGTIQLVGLHLFKTELCGRGSLSLVDYRVCSEEGEEGV